MEVLAVLLKCLKCNGKHIVELTFTLCILGSLPEDVVPFDAASDVSIEDQKVEALKRLQGALVNQKAGLAIALLRAAR